MFKIFNKNTIRSYSKLFTVKVPPLPESITQAYIGDIFVVEGSGVEEGSVLADYETDKINGILTSPCTGKITKILCTPQSSVGKEQSLFEIEETGKKPYYFIRYKSK